MLTTRRDILRSALGGSAMVSLAGTVPDFLLSASALAAEADADGRALVIVQLSGGNDGLNTVVPYADDAYNRNRRVLRVGADQVHKLDDHVGLHPAMSGFRELHDAGRLAVLQGIGYPNPNRSHFESMDIWHTAGASRQQGAAAGRMTGWLGRYLDRTAGRSADVAALHIGNRRQPLALRGEVVAVPSVDDLEGFRLRTEDEAAVAAAAPVLTAAERGAGDDLLGFLRRSSVSALGSSRRVAEAIGGYASPVEYPATALARQLQGVAQLIHAGLDTRVYYVEQEGFDTHSNQADAHYGLLSQLSAAVTAFVNDLEHQNAADRVLVMVFSEFGRRVEENASAGTDHGTAGPMFLAGGAVRPGVIGAHPSLTDLQDGDLKHHTDFRRVYAAALTRWLGIADAAPVLGGEYAPLDVIA